MSLLDPAIFHPFCHKTLDLLANRDHIHEKQTANNMKLEEPNDSLYAQLAWHVNECLRLAVGDDESAQRKYRGLLSAGCPHQLLQSGILVHDPNAMLILADIWDMWGGRDAYFSNLQAYQSSADSAFETRVLRKCSLCGNAGIMQKCSRCQSVWYCGKVCQQKDWKVHKHVCLART